MPNLYKSECYCTNLRRSANAISDFYDEELKGTGLSISQYYLLINLQRLGRANITHWAEFVGLERSTMVRNIKVLQSRCFIEVAEGHGKTFQLSEIGEKALLSAIPVWNKTQQRMKEFLGEEDSKAILRIGSKLQELKNKNLISYKPVKDGITENGVDA
ncbi:MAG: MarR family winged helix-turn-helix transcriptional regulator [Lachnospiraceae bacterium]|nr:MarR family winged helix-turn-helix transcriptional regulator [Lachnospiraceae bacterium]